MLLLALACRGTDTPHGKDGPGPIETVDDAPDDPGRRPLARLTNAEYDATVQGLLGTARTPGDAFPPDPVAYGFDNNGSVLTTTSIHVELWEAAADELLGEMFGRLEEETERVVVEAEGAGVSYFGEGLVYDETTYALREGWLSALVPVTYDGEFDLTVRAMGRTVDGEAARMGVRVDGTLVADEILTEVMSDHIYRIDIASPGVHTFDVEILNPGSDASGLYRTVTVDGLVVEGPLDPEGGRSAAYDTFVGCAADGYPTPSCARDAVAAFGEHAWRRPLSGEEVDWAMTLYDGGLAETLDEGESLELAFQGILLAPEFLFRVEADPTEGEAVRALDAWEVGARLAAFLWSANPDDAALSLAADGSLLEEQGLEDTVRRMIADPKAKALVDNLAGQWFDLRSIDAVAPDPVLYPTFDEELGASMREGMARAASSFFLGEEDLHGLLLREETWLDERLAAHHGVALPETDDGWAEVVLPGRVGLLGNAGWLAAQSHADRPSAAKRGHWILENLLCSPPPPPPPDVENLFDPVPEEGSMREQEEALRGQELCQSCHGVMDPLGFALGDFDAIGADRSVDEFGFPIDTRVEIDGTVIEGLPDVAAWVVADARLTACVVEKTMTYALGREMRNEDRAEIERIAGRFEEEGLTFEALAIAVATSDPFLWRSAPEVP